MARLGVSYEAVAAVAARMYAEGNNPTVDKVREGLGGTGSKSTIAPFLKRWRKENQDTQSQLEESLPVDLLQLVKTLHEHLQHQAALKVEEMEKEGEIIKAASLEKERVAAAIKLELEGLLEEMRQLLTLEKAKNENLREENQSLKVNQAQMSAEVDSMKERLVDYQKTTSDLHRQLEQTRKQFEHYQTTTAEQRTQERQAAEQRVQRLENDLTESRQLIAMQHKTVGQYEVQIQQADAQVASLKDRVDSLQQIHDEHHLAYQALSAQSHAQRAVIDELRGLLATLRGDYEKVQREMNLLHEEKHQLRIEAIRWAELSEQLQSENKKLLEEKNNLLTALKKEVGAKKEPGDQIGG